MKALSGTLLCILAGILWSFIGWASRRNVRANNHPFAFILSLSLCAALLVGSFAVAMNIAESGATPLQPPALLWMMASGLANCFGVYCMQRALATGTASAVWAIVQSAPLIPLLYAVGIHHERPTLLAWLGIASMAVAVGIIARSHRLRECRDATSHGNARGHRATVWAFAALALTGLQQTAMAQPSHYGMETTPAVRLFAFFVTMSSCAGLWCFVRRIRIRAKVWVFGAITAIAGLAGQYAILLALDHLASFQAAGMAYPTAVGSTIISFAIWNRIRGEQVTVSVYLAMGLIIVGLVGIGIAS